MSTTQAQAVVMEQTAQKFEQVNQSLEGMLNQLMRELDALRSGWQGRGGRSFDQVRLAWAQDQQKIHRALAETATAIRTAGKVYTATDEQASGRFTHTRPALPL